MLNYQIKNILVPTDFSVSASYAMQHAELIAKRTKARITLVHVIEPVNDGVGTSGMLGVAKQMEEKLQKERKRKLARVAHAAKKRSAVIVDSVVVVGRITAMLSKAITEMNADLVVMGTHGVSGFVENLLGSNTYRVASLTKVPLLSVHKKIGPAGYKHIVYPVRDYARVLKKLDHTILFARLFKARVHIIGLLKPGQKEHENEMRSQCTSVQKRFAENKITAEITYTSDSFFPEAAIRFAHTHPASLVVTVQDADFHLVELFQGTFTKRVLHKILAPVLTVPGN